MQGFFTQTTDAIALKLHTLFGHHHMNLHDKSQNSTSDFDTIMPLFGLLVKVLHAKLFLTNHRCCCFESSHTFWTSSNYLAGQVLKLYFRFWHNYAPFRTLYTLWPLFDFDNLVIVWHARYYHPHISLTTVYYRIKWQIVKHAVLWTDLVFLNVMQVVCCRYVVISKGLRKIDNKNLF